MGNSLVASAATATAAAATATTRTKGTWAGRRFSRPHVDLARRSAGASTKSPGTTTAAASAAAELSRHPLPQRFNAGRVAALAHCVHAVSHCPHRGRVRARGQWPASDSRVAAAGGAN